jgi:GMP synthase (glutamine-hydrolysing)
MKVLNKTKSHFIIDVCGYTKHKYLIPLPIFMIEQLLILDAGAQYGKVIDRRVRELGVETHILPLSTPIEDIRGKYGAIIISGGPQSVDGENAPQYDPEILNLGVPVLGICYGMHLLNHAAGGTVERKTTREDGQHTITVDTDSKLFTGLKKQQRVLLTHGDSIDTLADGFVESARSDGIVSAIEHPEKQWYGVQFHPEVDLTDNGNAIFSNFLFNIAGFSGTYTMENRIDKAIRYIQDEVGDKEVLALVSGGVDSTVLAALLYKALGKDKVHAIHVDNGLMRLNESAKVKKALEAIGVDLHVIDASEKFYNGKTTRNGAEIGPLNKTTSPEDKRFIIGDTFMRVSEAAIKSLGLPENTYRAQGTLRPDLIESASILASGDADAIKTHHNDTPLVRAQRALGRILEPLKDYHKDEVRKLGQMLGLPEELTMRQPFPGPGLGVRIICADKPYIGPDFDVINEQLQQFSTNGISATLIPIQTVGVQGDGRTYSYLAGLSGKQDWKKLFEIAHEIPKQIHGVNRIAYIFGETIQGPIRNITPTHLTPNVISQLQHADDIVNEVLIEYDLLRKLSQVPVVLFPANFGSMGDRSIAIRTFMTNDFMTGRPAVPEIDIPIKALHEMVTKICWSVQGISRVVYDLTSKPPGTTEWE